MSNIASRLLSLPPPDMFGKVAVVYGGWSAEKDVSKQSGAAVLNALQNYGVQVTGLDLLELKQQSRLDELKQYDVVFNMVHGRGGEDGQLQALLELYHIAYTGSGIAACAIAMDKVLTKRIWQGMNIPTPEFAVIDTNYCKDVESVVDQLVQQLNYPIIVKPAHEGSSIGMTRAENRAQLISAVTEASKYDACILVERWMHGNEYTVAILNNEALPVIQLKTTQAFYNYEAKYQRNDTQYLCPTDLSLEQEQEMQALALKAFHSIGCQGWGRVDVMTDENGVFKLLEVNTVPGMTDHSLVPMAAKAKGIDFQQLVVLMLMQALANKNQVVEVVS